MNTPSVHAYETQLEFSGKKGHAVVVEFGKPWQFVFWDKAQYIGCVDIGQGTWFTSEWCETNSPNDLHCYEPIMDKQLRWNRIQILESSPALAHSYGTPGVIQVHRDPGEPEDLHRGRVLEEGYDFSLRAYTFRKKGDDRVSITLTPSAPQINPVFLINGWSAPDVRVTLDGAPLDPSRYRAQMNGNDLTVWIEGTFTEPTGFLFTY